MNFCFGISASRCISKSLLCDGENNCGNNEDEKNCDTIHTDRSTVLLNDKNNRGCIISRSYCDPCDEDCIDPVDERNCRLDYEDCDINSQPLVFKKCISFDRICDRRNDCGHNEDEEKCTKNGTDCPLFLFTCSHSDRCISRSLLCDGNNDCGDNEDEKDCEISDKFICNGTDRVIYKYWVCDGENNCGNNADEENCFENSTLCTKDKFFCEGSKRCISELLVCDGKNDCESGEDEKYCYQAVSNFAAAELVGPSLPDLKPNERDCPLDKFLCPGLNTTKCIYKMFVCDGKDHCGNNGDELTCII